MTYLPLTIDWRNLVDTEVYIPTFFHDIIPQCWSPLSTHHKYCTIPDSISVNPCHVAATISDLFWYWRSHIPTMRTIRTWNQQIFYWIANLVEFMWNSNFEQNTRTRVKIKILTIILKIWFCFWIYLDLFHVDDSYNLLLNKCFPYIFDYIYQEVHYAIKLLLALFKRQSKCIYSYLCFCIVA